MVVAKSYLFLKDDEATHPGVQEAKPRLSYFVSGFSTCSRRPQTRAKPHVQALPGPHGDSHLPLHGTSRYKNKLVSLSNHCQKQRTFYQSKVVADALVLTRPKRDICQVVLRSFPLR